jgi:predicted nicotinamide N-methyase
MASPSPARLRAFVRRHTRLVPVPELPGLRLHLADDVMGLLQATADELGESDPDLPYWAFAWPGGLALVRFLADHPQEVAGRRVLDMASGSGLCAISAMRLGAASVQAVDVDPFAEAAADLNARANGVRVGFSRRDLLGAAPPPCDVILAGDVCYAEAMAGRMLAWLDEAADRGTRVLVGDPGRRYLPPGLQRLATYTVRASREIEDGEVKRAGVFTLSRR